MNIHFKKNNFRYKFFNVNLLNLFSNRNNKRAVHTFNELKVIEIRTKVIKYIKFNDPELFNLYLEHVKTFKRNNSSVVAPEVQAMNDFFDNSSSEIVSRLKENAKNLLGINIRNRKSSTQLKETLEESNSSLEHENTDSSTKLKETLEESNSSLEQENTNYSTKLKEILEESNISLEHENTDYSTQFKDIEESNIFLEHENIDYSTQFKDTIEESNLSLEHENNDYSTQFKDTIEESNISLEHDNTYPSIFYFLLFTFSIIAFIGIGYIIYNKYFCIKTNNPQIMELNEELSNLNKNIHNNLDNNLDTDMSNWKPIFYCMLFNSIIILFCFLLDCYFKKYHNNKIKQKAIAKHDKTNNI